MRVVSFTPRPLYPRYTLNMRLGEPQSLFGRRGEEKILPLPGLELRYPGRLARSQSLYLLSYPGPYTRDIYWKRGERGRVECL
jgi:hypothetical protein